MLLRYQLDVSNPEAHGGTRHTEEVLDLTDRTAFLAAHAPRFVSLRRFHN
jgi:hypothetical protein